MVRICVLGAGVVGLSTAVQLQDALPTARVTIVADKFHKDTTSDGAGGLFRPNRSKTPGVPLPVLRRWVKNSWDHYSKIAHSVDAKEAGVQVISGFQLYNDEEKNHLDEALLTGIIYHYRRLTEHEMSMFPGSKFKSGWFLTTLITESRHYLPYLMKKFKIAGGTVQKKTVQSFNEFVGHFDIVVNCAGFENYSLLNDNQLVPIRGQLFRVKAPWLQHFIFTGDDVDCYIIPGMDNVVVGGTQQKDDTDLALRATDSSAIWRRACAVAPSLRNATVEWEWVGIRPFRDPLRLEKEVMSFPNGKLKVVHNYGHGADGICLSWGTSVDAVQLVQQMLDSGVQAKL